MPDATRPCPSCDREVATTAAFCPYCGSALPSDPVQATPPTEARPAQMSASDQMAALLSASPAEPAPVASASEPTSIAAAPAAISAPAPRRPSQEPLRGPRFVPPQPAPSSAQSGGQRIHFEGSFIEYFVMALGLLVVSALTFGLATPYYFYWSLKYFFTKLHVGDQNIVFTGSFGEYFLTALGLIVVSVLTFGLALPYFGYWTFKYFFAHLELQPAGTAYATSRPRPVR